MRVFNVDIPNDCPVLIAGPTASGKSSLALEIAEKGGGIIINADAIQVYSNWRVLTARPSIADEMRAEHHLFGHIAYDQAYSVGEWLREVAPFLSGNARPIIVGGTGLYFAALTEGLVDIPETPSHIREEADALRKSGRVDQMIRALDERTRRKIDLLNPMRVQRAWEVFRATHRGLAEWQAETPPPLLPRSNAIALHLDAPKDWLNERITRRFNTMLDEGALDEATSNLATWHPELPSSKAIGAPELIAYIRGQLSLSEARIAATIATRQFAKRQRTWFRARMKDWTKIDPRSL